MKNKKQFQGWRAEQIAKVFLLNSGLFDLTEITNYSHKDKGYDFIGILKANQNKRLGIDVKATKYSKSEIKNKLFSKTYLSELPLLQLFVNYDKESGYFRIVTENRKSELKVMKRETLINEIKNYAQQWL